MANDLEGANRCHDVLKQSEQEGGLIIDASKPVGRVFDAKVHRFARLSRNYFSNFSVVVNHGLVKRGTSLLAFFSIPNDCLASGLAHKCTKLVVFPLQLYCFRQSYREVAELG